MRSETRHDQMRGDTTGSESAGPARFSRPGRRADRQRRSRSSNPTLVDPAGLQFAALGATLSRRFLASSRLDALTLRRSEDAFVDELFAPCVEIGAPLMRANFPRAYLDLNREPFELDPLMFDGRLPAFANTRSLRVAGGLGTIPRVVGEAQEIYRGPIPVAEAMARIASALPALPPGIARLSIERARKSLRHRRGARLPFHALEHGRGRGDRFRGRRSLRRQRGPVDCRDAWKARFDAPAIRCGATSPMPGGFITEHYGAPATSRHVVQIEINRALYMDERAMAKSARWPEVSADLFAMASLLANRVARSDRPVAGRGRMSGLTRRAPKKGGRLRRHKRPESREETPKEGICGRSCRTATISPCVAPNARYFLRTGPARKA